MFSKIPIQYRLPIVLVILLIPFAFVNGINTLNEGYQSTPNSTSTIDASNAGGGSNGECRKITNTSANTYFIPTKMNSPASEWTQFLNNLPPSTVASQCCATGQCWNGSSCITADADGDGVKTTACLSTNNGGADCSDSLASVYPGAPGTCNGYLLDSCNAIGTNSIGPVYTPDKGDGSVKLVDNTNTLYYSSADCTGSPVAKFVDTVMWDADCNTSGTGNSAASGVVLRSDYFGIIGGCYNGWNIVNQVPTGGATYNSWWNAGGGCRAETGTANTYAPNPSAWNDPPGKSCRCSTESGSEQQIVYSWTCL